MIIDAQKLYDEIASYVANYDYRILEENGNYTIILQNHVALPWYVHKKKRLFQGIAPSSFYYEPVATAVLDYLIDTQPVSRLFDIGAAHGYFSFLAAGRVDKEIEAYAFEMQPHIFEAIQKRARALGRERVKPYLSGMSDLYEGEQKIWYSGMKMFQSEPGPSEYRHNIFKRFKYWLKGRAHWDALHTAQVTIDSIDHFCSAHDVVPEVIKIDVDGYEQKVICGGLETFAKSHPFILLEIHKMKLLRRFAGTRRDVVKPLFDLGYRCIFFDNHHELAGANPTLVELDHPLWDRDRTDFVLFF